MKIISLREQASYLSRAISYFQQSWPNVNPAIYEDCLKHSFETTTPLPQWYLLEHDNKIIGCAGLITNDFISRMDLYPWICALFIEKDFRGQNLGSHLIHKAIEDAKKFGFEHTYLCTDHIGYYEKMGFRYIGDGIHPWGETSRIYQKKTIV